MGLAMRLAKVLVPRFKKGKKLGSVYE
jgi:hypothetical protein